MKKISFILLILGLYVSGIIGYASDKYTADNVISYEMESKSDVEQYIPEEKVLRDYVKRYVPEDATFVSTEVTSKFIYNANTMLPREVELTGADEEEIKGSMVSNVYTFSSLENGEERFDVIVDCYFIKTWKPYKDDRFSILFDGYLNYISPVEGELWGRNSEGAEWSFEKELGVSTNVIYGEVLGDTSPYPRILLHFPATRVNEGQEQNYTIIYEVAEKKTPAYVFFIPVIIVILIAIYYWKKRSRVKDNRLAVK